MPHDSAETIIFLRQRSRQRGRQNGLTLVPATVFLRRLPASGVISRVLEHIATKFQWLSQFQWLSPYFRSQAFQWCHFRYRVTPTSARNPR